MAGKIKAMCNTIIEKRAAGNGMIEKLTKTKLILKGVNPDQFTASSPDDQVIIAKLVQIAKDLGISL